jgi:hypothetical protein
LQRYKILFICGRNSSRLNRNFTELDVRRAFTVFLPMTILEENHHSLLIVEHDPLLYEDAGRWWATWPRPSSRPPGRPPSCSTPWRWNPRLQKMAELADRVFYIYNEPAAAKGRGKPEARMAGEQRTLEAYS